MQVPFLQTLDARALRFLIGRLSDPWITKLGDLFLAVGFLLAPLAHGKK